jgi:NADH-quinone oxidoreductase subunit I
MFGFGVLRGMMVTLKHFIETYTEDPKRVKARALTPDAVRQTPNDSKGLFTVQYPEEKLAIPERFRFYPMLIVEADTGQDLCTSCGICAKVCPPQCIWIVRGTKPDGKPKPEPEEFYIDTTICMQCGYCAEFCPFDAIKMNHDYELSAYERHESAIYDKTMLSVTTTYYARTHPRAWAEESAAREAKEAKKSGGSTAAEATADTSAQAASAAPAPAVGQTQELLPSGRPKPISARAAKAARLAAEQAAANQEVGAHGAAGPSVVPSPAETAPGQAAAQKAAEGRETPPPTIEQTQSQSTAPTSTEWPGTPPPWVGPDDLTIIEGIGPRIAELFHAADVITFSQLSELTIPQIQTILDAGGPRFRVADPKTWAEQARLAAAGEWDALKVMQDNLKGGRNVD